LCYVKGTTTFYILGFAFFVIGSISDSLDGYYARKYNSHSRLGRIIDPIADKVLTLSALVVLAYIGMILWWIVAIIILRDLLITTLRLINTKNTVVISPTKLAKNKTIYHMTVIVLMMFLPIFGYIPENEIYSIPNILMIIAAILSWVSVIPYLKGFYNHNKKQRS